MVVQPAGVDRQRCGDGATPGGAVAPPMRGLARTGGRHRRHAWRVFDRDIPVLKIACEVLAGTRDLAMARVASRRFARCECESTVREGFPRLLGCPGLMAAG